MTTAYYPLFIRKIISKEQTNDLKNVLATMREGKPFLLVVLDDTEEIKDDWGLESVRNYYLRQPEPYIWKGDVQAWKEIFHELGLELSNAQASSDEH